MKLSFIEEKYDCKVLAVSDVGLIEVTTYFFNETTRTDVTNTYYYKVKWLGTIQQNSIDLVNITYEEYWSLEFVNTTYAVQLLKEVINASFVAFEIVFNQYTTALESGELSIPKDDNFIEEQARTAFEQMNA